MFSLQRIKEKFYFKKSSNEIYFYMSHPVSQLCPRYNGPLSV